MSLTSSRKPKSRQCPALIDFGLRALFLNSGLWVVSVFGQRLVGVLNVSCSGRSFPSRMNSSERKLDIEKISDSNPQHTFVHYYPSSQLVIFANKRQIMFHAFRVIAET
jgi:hypothetical protein